VRILILYGVIGVIGALTHMGALVFLVESAGWNEVAASTVGFILTVLISYLLHKNVTYKGRGGGRSFYKFILVSSSGFILNGTMMFLAVEWGSLPYILAQACVMALIPISNFLLNHFWTFRKKA
jgi:putative flippase GtrA